MKLCFYQIRYQSLEICKVSADMKTISRAVTGAVKKWFLAAITQAVEM
jgi:hypothetical protein